MGLNTVAVTCGWAATLAVTNGSVSGGATSQGADVAAAACDGNLPTSTYCSHVAGQGAAKEPRPADTAHSDSCEGMDMHAWIQMAGYRTVPLPAGAHDRVCICHVCLAEHVTRHSQQHVILGSRVNEVPVFEHEAQHGHLCGRRGSS
jgi:hypothetical protein